MYLGSSATHHSTIGKILNLKTGAVSPQFHVVYDELFTTSFGKLTETAFDKDHWSSLIDFGIDHASELDHETVAPSKSTNLKRVSQDLFETFLDSEHVTPPPPPVPEGEDTFWPDSQDQSEEGTSVSEGAQASEGAPSSEGAPTVMVAIYVS